MRVWNLVFPPRKRLYMNQIFISSTVKLGLRNRNFWRIKYERIQKRRDSTKEAKP